MPYWVDIAEQITRVKGDAFVVKTVTQIAGGCINETYCIEDGGQRYFVKLNTVDSLHMFEAEAAGLGEICKTKTLRVPEPICWSRNDQQAWLVLEYIEMNRSHQKNDAELGSGLAAMHRVYARQFGWVRHNTIGMTPQINNASTDWVRFWRYDRLGYQLDLAKSNGYLGTLQNLGEQLMEHLSRFFGDNQPAPSLLHGDLWGGNYGFDDTGQPVLFDPAVYYGDREVDLAMTELFGGFSSKFYSAYQHDYPLESGYNTRRILYNLYHVLNHLNLFGGSYLSQAERMMDQLLAETR